MRNNQLFLYVLLSFMLLIMSGCASAVRCKYIVPSMKYNQPYAIITETEMRSSESKYLSARIKGFYTSGTDYEELEGPVNIDSAGDLIVKGYYTLTPFGWVTHAIHHKKGRRIRVPAEKIGICIEHKYYREISREFLRSDSQYNYYLVKYESYDWDDTIWGTLEQGQEYYVHLMSTSLYSSKDKQHQIAGTETAALPREFEVKTEEIAEDSSGNAKGAPVSSESPGPNANNTVSSVTEEFLASDQEIIDAGVKKAKELGLNPVPVCENEDGSQFIPSGFIMSITNGRVGLANGDMLINATKQTIYAKNVPLLRGEYAVVKEDKAEKGESNLVSE